MIGCFHSPHKKVNKCLGKGRQQNHNEAVIEINLSSLLLIIFFKVSVNKESKSENYQNISIVPDNTSKQKNHEWITVEDCKRNARVKVAKSFVRKINVRQIYESESNGVERCDGRPDERPIDEKHGDQHVSDKPRPQL